jgi:hypothetical protein
MQKAYIIGGVLLGAVIIAALILVPRWMDKQVPPPPPPTVPVESDPVPVPETFAPALPVADPEPLLPLLDDSDGFVAEALEPMEIPEPWIGKGDLIRRLAVVIENAARGDYPRRQLAFLSPAGPFRVLKQDDGTLLMDPAGYARYDGYVDMLERMPPDQMASLLIRVQPLLAEALNELGLKDPGDDLLDAAIDRVLAIPVLEREVPLLQPNVLYEFADPVLETLTPLQKQILRTGPDNVQRIQAYLRQVREAL